MKKKICVIVAVVLLVLMLIPVKMNLEDGGTKIYRAVLYTVTDWHQLNPKYFEDDNTSESMYIEGVTVHILGIKVYGSVQKSISGENYANRKSQGRSSFFLL